MEKEEILIKISVPKANKEFDKIRKDGLLFEFIAEALQIERKQIEEIIKNPQIKNSFYPDKI